MHPCTLVAHDGIDAAAADYCYYYFSYPVSAEELDRLSALSETLRQELSSNGVPDDQLLSRSIQFGGKSLPNFTVVRSGQWARLSAASLSEAVLYLLRDESCPPFEGLRNAMVKGSYYFELAKSS